MLLHTLTLISAGVVANAKIAGHVRDCKSRPYACGLDCLFDGSLKRGVAQCLIVSLALKSDQQPRRSISFHLGCSARTVRVCELCVHESPSMVVLG